MARMRDRMLSDWTDDGGRYMESMSDVVAERRGDIWPKQAAHLFDLFVVHAAADTEFVHGYLLPALNLPSSRVLLVDELPLGSVVVSEIDRGVSRSRFTVVVLSRAYLEDRWAVFGEQLASHLSVEDVHVIPLRLTDCELPLYLEARVSLDFTDRASWDLEAARLRDLLHTVAPAPELITCPYPGMRPFAENEASRFFGRSKEIEDLIGRLDHGEREIYVIGPSGSGKSSLVRAGLVHALEAGYSRLERSFVVRTMRPGEQPSDRLAKALEGDLATPAETIGALLARHPPAERVLVFIDQVEEMFTLAGAAERQLFIAMLRALRTEPRCYLLLALRADFFGAFMDSDLWPHVADISRLDVAPLRGAALAQAITEPAARVGVYLEARLCDRLIADAATEPGALPLVQETLRQLWENRCQRLLGLAAYEELGDGESALHVAIARHADATMRSLTSAQRMIARRVLLRLVNFGEGRADTRRQQEVQALQSAADDSGTFSHVLQRLVANRLITIDGTGRDPVLADLSHEALITGWPVFREWIARRRVDEQRRRRLEAKVSEWIEYGSGSTSVLDPVGIAEAEQWMKSYAARALGYRPELRALVAASRSQIEGVERRRRRGMLRTIAVLGVFSIVAFMSVLVAWRQRHAAQHQLGMVYLEQGRTLLLDRHRMQALPYLVAAKTEGIESPLLHMFLTQASRTMPLVTCRGHSSSVMEARFSQDGRYVVTASNDNTARIWDAATGMQVTRPLQHKGPVHTAAFSPDGKWVVTASDDNTARIWDAALGRQLIMLLGHQGPVHAAAFSPDGTRVVTASDDNTVRIWNASTGEAVTPPLEHRGHVRAAAFSPDGTRVVTASADKTARIWDASTGQPVTSPLEHDDEVSGATFDRDGTHVVTVSHNKTARVWDALTGQPVAKPLEHQGHVNSAVFSPDGRHIVTASDDKTARVWDAVTGVPITPPLEHQDIVLTAMFSPDGRRVVTASFDKTARVWDASTGMPMTPPLEHQGYVYSAAFSADSARVVTASFDKNAQIWDAVSGAREVPPLDHQDFVHSAAFSPDGTRVVTASFDGTARVWDTATGVLVTPPLEHQGIVWMAAFSPDGTRVVTASNDKTARVWDAATGMPVTPPLKHQDTVWVAVFSPDGTRVVTASGDKTARVWDATTGTPVTKPLWHEDIVWTAAFSADGTRVVTASNDATARVWDALSGARVTKPLRHQEAVLAAAFSPDGTRVITASQDNTAQVWDAISGLPVSPSLEHQGPVNAAAFSPDGTRVVTASQDNTARVWDASSGIPMTPPFDHQGQVNAVAFSPDGTRVVTASDDKTARVWEVSTGKAITLPLDHRGEVHAAAFSPDGNRLITASNDNKARIWTLSSDNGSLEDWVFLARCSPFALVDGILTTKLDPPRVCPRH